MKIYFSAAVVTKPEISKRYNKIIEILKNEGHVVYEYVSEDNDPGKLMDRSEEEILSTFKTFDKYLKNADLYITEISTPSVGLGYEISKAVELKKPVLALNYDQADFQPLATIEGLKSKYVTYTKYNEDNIDEIIQKFTKEAKSKLDTKFILIIPPEIDRYLEVMSDRKRMHKAQLVRRAIEKEMDQDEEWKEYLEM